jgi:hypothetical protein
VAGKGGFWFDGAVEPADSCGLTSAAGGCRGGSSTGDVSASDRDE